MVLQWVAQPGQFPSVPLAAMDHGVFVLPGNGILPIRPIVGIYAPLTRKGEWPKVRASRGTEASRARCTRFSAAVGKWVSKLR